MVRQLQVRTNDGIAPDSSRAWIEVDLDAVKANCRAVQAMLGRERSMMAVVKADAYGHGLVAVARAALRAGPTWLGVATVAEGAALRGAGVTAPVALLCSPAPDEWRAVVAYGLTPMVGDSETATALKRAAGGAPIAVHLDIDTGMGRSGALPEDALKLWRACLESGLKVEGLCTHFADAEGVNPDGALGQWERFDAVRRTLTAAGAQFRWIHAANSAAVLRFAANGCNLVRTGLLIYGILPDLPLSERSGDPPEEGADLLLARLAARNVAAALRPALALKARVGMVRDLPAGHTISYGATYRLASPSQIATVLIGYGDGFPRRLSNCGDVLVRGGRAPILGRVCMDQTVVDVTGIRNVIPGDVAHCIGSDGPDRISVESIARRIDTTEHEVTTGLTARLPRIYRDTANEA